MIYCQSLPDIWKGLVKEYREKELKFSDKISHKSFKLTLKGAFQIFKENLGFFSYKEGNMNIEKSIWYSCFLKISSVVFVSVKYNDESIFLLSKKQIKSRNSYTRYKEH